MKTETKGQGGCQGKLRGAQESKGWLQTQGSHSSWGVDAMPGL